MYETNSASRRGSPMMVRESERAFGLYLMKISIDGLVSFLQKSISCQIAEDRAMEVEAHEKKGHRAFAKAIKSFGSHRRSNRFVSSAERFASANFFGFL